MESNDIELYFIDNIKNKNRENRAYLRYLIGFSAVFAVSLISGIIASLVTQKAVSDDLKTRVVCHFTDVFAGCSKPVDYFTVIITSSSADLRYLLLICTSGFTFFCKYATGAMVAFKAFSMGFSSEFLFLSLKKGLISLTSPALSFILFVAAELMIVCVVVYLSTKATLFSYDFRKLRGCKKMILRSPIIYRYIFLFLTAIGFVITVNAAYCGLSVLI